MGFEYFGAVRRPNDQRSSAWLRNYEVCCLVLIPEGVSPDDDRACPSWNNSRDALENDGFAKDRSIQDASYGSVRTLPHLLQPEFYTVQCMRIVKEVQYVIEMTKINL